MLSRSLLCVMLSLWNICVSVFPNHCYLALKRGNPLIVIQRWGRRICVFVCVPTPSLRACNQAWQSTLMSNKWRKLPYCHDFGKSPYPPHCHSEVRPKNLCLFSFLSFVYHFLLSFFLLVFSLSILKVNTDVKWTLIFYFNQKQCPKMKFQL